MNTIKITINKLGAIRNSVVELAPVMVFSGESGLGKSYLAILCHYFFDLLLDTTRLNRFFKEKGLVYTDMQKNMHGVGAALTLKKTELEEWMAADALQYLSYMLNNAQLKGDLRVELPECMGNTITIAFEEEIAGMENDEDVYVKLSALGLTYRAKDETIDAESPFAVLLRYGLQNTLLGDFKAIKETYVLPPSRGPVMTEEVTPRTGMYEKFKNDLIRMNRTQPHAEEADQNLRHLLRDVLEGTVKRTTDSYQYTIDGGDMPISAAAASIREIAPLAMLVERTDLSKTVLMMEEPEAHLHPLKQRKMADIVSVMCSGGAYMQITTHSDYFLRRLNELISLKRLHAKCKTLAEFEQICNDVNIDKRLEFDYERLAAYLLERDEDGMTVIKKQELTNGIPFASFSSAIEESLNNRHKLNNYAEKYGCD